ncbi:MAG: T9SS type A sorting domain-containing protein [Bacteroidales bacterium]|nr:T9SS type A sorting domain-containing protein [Bacteroidales bacterium]
MKKNIKILLVNVIFLMLMIAPNWLAAQPAEFAGDINSWATPSMTDRGSVKATRIQASATNANSGFKFWSAGSWSPQWGGSNADYTRGLNTKLSGQAYYSANGGGGWEHNLEFNMTSGNYYTFIVGQLAPTNNNDLSILETTYNPNTITSVSRSPTTPDNSQTVTVTANLSGTLNTGEYAFVRYTTDAWTNSSLVAMSFSSGTDYTATIPAQLVGTTVSYYVLTSNDNTFNVADADYFTLELDNNSNLNYSYTVATLYSTAQDGDWETDATWTCNCDPPAGANVQINHAVDITTNVANDPGSMEITAGNSITFGASGQIAATTLTNNGTIDMTAGGLLTILATGTLTNNSTFTAGSGEVYFPGTGTVSGSVTFYDVSLAGGVNFGGSSSIDNILQFYGGGYLDVNSITYNSGSTLKYAANYTLNSGDKTWYSNVASSGSAQEGVPWNVQIPSGVTVQLNDSYQFDMNGSLTIDGIFRLGTDGGTHWGDLALRGDFVLNSGATFNHNSRAVKFIGTNLQEIKGTQAPTFGYIEVNNSSGVTLSQNISVVSGFTFTSGKMTIGDYDVNIGTASLSGYGTDKYFITSGTGYVIRNVGNSEVNFPVGTPTQYSPAYLTQAGTQENLYVRVKQGIDNPTNDDDFTVNLQWTINEQTAGSNNLTTKFQWNSTDENTYFDRNGQVKIGRYITGSYSSSAATVAGSDPYTASASSMSDDISAEIPFIVGNTMAFTSNGYRTAQNGNWATGTTWVGGVVPPANATCAILHHVTVNSSLNDADEVTIYADKSVTFDASAALTVNGTLANNGMLKTNDATALVTINGILNNSSGASLNMTGGGTLTFTDGSTFANLGTFTSGTGTIDFQGNGIATGTLSFYNLNIAGNVDLGSSATLNNTLTLSSSGDLITNSITYSEGSLIVFDMNYSLSDNKLWYRNTASTGFAQEGVPWNVKVNAGKILDYAVGDNFYRAINGDLIIVGTFTLSGTSGGNFKLKGDFVNTGTFNHNNRFVEFNGNTSQKINSISNFYDVIINNNANVLLENNLNVLNKIDFTLGKIVLGNNDLTVLGNIVNYNSLKYLVTNGSGYLIKNVATSSAGFYPIGTFSSYNPANLTQGASATTDNVGVRVTNSIENVVDDPTQIVNVQWTINEAVVGGNDLTTQFFWNLTDEAGSFNRSSGIIETRYFTAGAYTPAGPPYSTIAGANPYDATASYSYTGNLVNLPFIVADATAFSGAIFTIANGNWNAAATWNGGTIPGTGQCALVRHNVILDISPTVKTVSISSSGNLDCNGKTITLDNGGAIANSNIFYANGGKVVFSGAGSISTGSITFYDVDINGAVSFGSNSTIAGILTINAAGYVNVNPPKYANTSTLKYNQGGNVARSYEWQYNLNVGDPGYPANVQVSNNTTLDIDADNNDDNYYQTRFLNGNITIDALSTITLNNMGGGTAESEICGLYAKGNIINNGTIILSSSYGGDMMLEGDLVSLGTINWNSRAVFFTGASGTIQNIIGVTQIPFILITDGATVKLNNNLDVNGTGDQFITFARPSSTNTGKVDLNGYTLSCTGAGNIELNDISGAEVIGTGRVEVSGGNATYSGIGSGTLEFGPNATLAINGGIMTFPSTLGVVTIYGTLEVGDGATITNIPTYGDNSTLHYKKGGSFTMGVEWGAGSNIADNIPYNVTVSQGTTPSILLMNATRYALGELLIEQNATLEVANATGQLTVNNLTVDADGSIVLKSPSDNGVAGSLITYGTVSNSGTMIAERYVSGFKYTYLSPPNTVTNSQLFTNNSNGYYNPNFYSYNQAFDSPFEPTSATYSIWKDPTYEFDNAWEAAHDGSGGTGIILDVAGRGYAYYNDINKMFEFDGTFTSGNQTLKVFYDDNDNGTNLNGGYFDGWNLIANPYPSAMDWTNASWDRTYVDASIYYWDGTFENEGNYKYYIASAYDDGTNVVNGGSQFIPASQAVFVKAKLSAGSVGENFTIPNNARTHNTQDFWGKSKATKNSKTSAGYIRLLASANNLTDELVVRYIPEGTVDYDGDFDAYKLYSSSSNAPQIYSYNSINGAGYAINSLPVDNMNDVLPLGIEIQKQGLSECKIELTDNNMGNKHIYLEDVELSNYQNLTVNSVYSFNITDGSDVRGRFFIHYQENSAPYAYVEIPDCTVNFGDTVDYLIPENAFLDVNLGDILTITATNIEGLLLPVWLFFDASKGRFYGVPSNVGSQEIVVVATDKFGAQASLTFMITVNAVLPQVQTQEITQIGANNATVSNLLLSNGGIDVDEVGICWSTNNNPTLEDNYFVSVLLDDLFIGTAENLTPNTLYYVRSYAKNVAGTQYGNVLNFTTALANINSTDDYYINVYPNPAADVLFINSDKEIIQVNIVDLTGKTVFNNNYDVGQNTLKIKLNNLSGGIYFLKIQTKFSTDVQKIIVK